ncbi:hypothetical protein DSO57_1023388 [Entomophthora muscae]|uniref:Uncharacterized protein n=1 Tax=Entomophthora muscae TaxID=34485 RepID=A0ACC2SFR7_9FUNG|nr:hypothetical protein DSO57_1023388 [Entomophthora muscae]
MAAVTCFIQYAGSMGQVLGLAIHSAIFNGVLAQELASALPERADVSTKIIHS